MLRCGVLSLRVLLASSALLSCQPSKVVGFGELALESANPAQFETLELLLKGRPSTNCPFTEYASVVFTNGAQEFSVDGFYDGTIDGAHTWRVRFMPNASGFWNYRWTLPDTHGEGRVYVAERNPNNHGHVRVNANAPWLLRHDDGTPYYWFGGKWFSAKNYGPASKLGVDNDRLEDGSGHDAHYSDEEFSRYLSQLQRFDHNGALLKVSLFPLEDDGLSWDLAWLRRADRWLAAMQRANVYAQLTLFDPWSRKRGSPFEFSEDPTEHVINAWEDASDEVNLGSDACQGEDLKKRNYIRYLVARYAGYSNVYWELVNRVDEPGTEAGNTFVDQANEKYLPWLREFDPYDLPVGASDIARAREMPDIDIEFSRNTSAPPEPSAQRALIHNELVHVCQGPQGSLRQAYLDAAIREPASRHCYRYAFWQAFVAGALGTSEASWLDISRPLIQPVLDVMRDQQRLRQIVEDLLPEIDELEPMPEFIEPTNGYVGTRAKPGHAYVSYFAHQRAPERITIHLPPEKVYSYRWVLPGEPPPRGDGELSGKFVGSPDGIELQRPGFEEDLALIVEYDKRLDDAIE